jgi:hypothetical protein
VSETSAWQFARFPSWPQYCRATPTDSAPFFGSAVSSMTSTPSGPPTSRSASHASTAHSGASFQAGLLMKWCNWSCPEKPRRAAMGCRLLRSPGPSRPRR